MIKSSLKDKIGSLFGFESAEQKRKRFFTEKAEELTRSVNEFKIDLVAFEQKEFELLSMRYKILQKARRRNPQVLQFSNIYHEPLFVSIEDKISRGSDDAALKIFSKQSVYTYWLRSDYVSIWNGNNFWGNLLPDGRFIYKTNKVVGQLIPNGKSDRLEVHVSDQLQVGIDLSNKEIKASTRALTYSYFTSESAFELSKILTLFILTNPESSFKLDL